MSLQFNLTNSSLILRLQIKDVAYVRLIGCSVSLFTYFSNVLLCLTAFDISADLTELGKTPVAVVCAGAKSILDIELTLEYLVRSFIALKLLSIPR